MNVAKYGWLFICFFLIWRKPVNAQLHQLPKLISKAYIAKRKTEAKHPSRNKCLEYQHNDTLVWHHEIGNCQVPLGWLFLGKHTWKARAGEMSETPRLLDIPLFLVWHHNHFHSPQWRLAAKDDPTVQGVRGIFSVERNSTTERYPALRNAYRCERPKCSFL